MASASLDHSGHLAQSLAMSIVPEEVVYIFLDFVPFRDKINLRAVCKFWDVAVRYNLWQITGLQVCKLASCEVTSFLTEKYFASCKRAHLFQYQPTLCGWNHEMSGLFDFLAKYCPNLRVLIIYDFHVALKELVKVAKNLEYFDVLTLGASSITDERTLAIMFAPFKKLVRFRMSEMSICFTEALYWFTKYWSRTKPILSIQIDNGPWPLFFREHNFAFPNILEVECSFRMNDMFGSMIELMKKCGNLRSVTLMEEMFIVRESQISTIFNQIGRMAHLHQARLVFRKVQSSAPLNVHQEHFSSLKKLSLTVEPVTVIFHPLDVFERLRIHSIPKRTRCLRDYLWNEVILTSAGKHFELCGFNVILTLTGSYTQLTSVHFKTKTVFKDTFSTLSNQFVSIKSIQFDQILPFEGELLINKSIEAGTLKQLSGWSWDQRILEKILLKITGPRKMTVKVFFNPGEDTQVLNERLHQLLLEKINSQTVSLLCIPWRCTCCDECPLKKMSMGHYQPQITA